MIHADYESWVQRTVSVSERYEPITLPPRPTGRIGTMSVVEAYSGVDIVSWYGTIERQLVGMEQEYEKLDNEEYQTKIHTFLNTWRDNPITGSMNVETLEVLEAATAQLASDPWKLANYFSNLRDQLRKLIAAQEELPLGAPPESGGGSRGGGGSRKKAARPPADFGPTAGAPGGAPPDEALGLGGAPTPPPA